MFTCWPFPIYFELKRQKKIADAAKKQHEIFESVQRRQFEQLKAKTRQAQQTRFNQLMSQNNASAFLGLRSRNYLAQQQAASQASQTQNDNFWSALNPLNPFSPLNPMNQSAPDPEHSRYYGPSPSLESTPRDCPAPVDEPDTSTRYDSCPAPSYDNDSSSSSSYDSSSSSRYDSGSLSCDSGSYWSGD